MKLSGQETEILQELAKTPDSLAPEQLAKLSANDNFADALNGLKDKGFVDIAENGNVVITEMGNAALASL